MNYKISFIEMDKLVKEQLSKQPLISLEEKRKQFQNLNNNRKQKK